MKGPTLVCVVFIISTFQQAVMALKPKMTPAKAELHIQEGDELKIHCQGEGKLQFSTQKSEYDVHDQSNFTISYNLESGAYTFLRPHAIGKDTGWYGCADEGIAIKNDDQTIEHPSEEISWIYVYVNSSDPFARMHWDDYPIVSAVEGTTAVIPCRPTNPKLPVRLFKNYDEVVVLPDAQDVSYDPKIGYILKQVTLQDSGILFVCFISGNPEYDVPYLLSVRWK